MSDRRTPTPSLGALAFILRHPETWPEDFEWNFLDCHRCAMGLARIMWPEVVRSPDIRCVSMAFFISEDEALSFFGGHAWVGRHPAPADVASKIEAYLG